METRSESQLVVRSVSQLVYELVVPRGVELASQSAPLKAVELASQTVDRWESRLVAELVSDLAVDSASLMVGRLEFPRVAAKDFRWVVAKVVGSVAVSDSPTVAGSVLRMVAVLASPMAVLLEFRLVSPLVIQTAVEWDSYWVAAKEPR